MNEQRDNANRLLDEIKQVARDFRNQCKSGNLPRIESWIGKVPEAGRENLFQNLLQLELRFREKQGESPTSSNYIKRFPHYAGLIRQAFFESTQMSQDGEIDAVASDSENDSADRQETLAFGLLPAEQIGEYEIVRELGRGGFGVVYEAQHLKRRNRVALKTLPAGMEGRDVNAEKLHRFRREFRMLSELNHPNLVGMQTLEVDGDRWFFTMDLIDGRDFLEYVRPGDQLSVERLRNSLGQLVAGVTSLHQRGIVHRDLKPSNVLVKQDGTVIILDFGLVAQLQKAGDQTASLRSGMFAGTPRYAAPEQMFGERSEASDWYAIGVMLYESLSGRPPFEGSQMELLQKKQNEDPPRIAEQPDLPPDLAELADAMVQREAKRRPASEQIVAFLGLNLESRVSRTTSQGAKTTGSSLDASSHGIGDMDLDVSMDGDQFLIGREEQMAKLREIQQDLFETRSPIVCFIKGLSGEGKSSLAEKFLRPFRVDKSMLILSGRCYDRESVPFKVVDSQIDSLVRYLRNQSSEDLESLIPDDIQMLAHLFPLLRRVKAINDRCKSSLKGIDDKQIRYRGFAALKDLLFNIGRMVPIVMFVDDLQWGDADSAEAMANLLAPPDPPPILFLGSYRSDEVGESPFLNDWQHELEKSRAKPQVCEVQVEPLSADDCLKYLVNRFGDETGTLRQAAVELYENTRGNPYFLEQLVEGFDPETGALNPIPLEQVIDNRLSKCPEDAKTLLEVIAVAGKAVSLKEAAEVARLSDETFATITHMRSERLVRLVGSEEDQLVDTYHDKIREEILARMSDQRRRDLHARFGALIDANVSSVSDVNSVSDQIFDMSRHYFEAQHDKAFEKLMLAMRLALEAYAREVAHAIFRNLQKVKPDNLERGIAYRYFLDGARALSGCGLYQESVANYQSALGHAGDNVERAACYLELYLLHFSMSEIKKSWECYELGLANLREKTPRTTFGRLFRSVTSVVRFYLFPKWLTTLLNRRTQKELELLVEFYQSANLSIALLDMANFIHVGAQPLRYCKLISDPRLRTKSLILGYTFFNFAGLPFLSRSVTRKVRSLLDEVQDPTGVHQFYAHVNEYVDGENQLAIKNLQDAAKILNRCNRYEERMAYHFAWHASADLGDAKKQFAMADREYQVARRSSDDVFLAYSQYGKAEALARLGHVELAEEMLDRSFRILERLRSPYITTARIQKALTSLQKSDYSEARISSAVATQELFNLRLQIVNAPAPALYVESVLAMNWISNTKKISRRDRRRAGWAAFFARRLGAMFPGSLPYALRVSGRLAYANGGKRRALKYYAKAIQAAGKISARGELARTLIDRSMVVPEKFEADRERGLEILRDLHCVLPVAEQEYLGIKQQPYPLEDLE